MSLPSLIAAAFLWTAVLVRTPGARASHRQRTLWLTILPLAMVATLDVPAVVRAVDDVTNLVNVGHLFKYLLALMAAAGAHEVVRSGYLPPSEARAGLRRRRTAVAVLTTVLVMLFAFAPVHSLEVASLTAAHAATPQIAVFLALFLATLAAILVSIVRHTLWYREQMEAGSIRTSMGLIAGAAALGLVFVTYKAVLVALAPFVPEFTARTATTHIGTIVLAACLLLFAVGTGWHIFLTRLPSKRLVAFRQNRELRRLWRDLRDVVPNISLEDALAHHHAGGTSRPRGRDFPVARHEVELRYFRRVTEILDGELALRPYVPRHLHEMVLVTAREHGVPARDEAAIVERALLEVARRRLLRGEEPAPGRTPPVAPQASTFDREAQRLQAMAAQRHRALAVADALEHASVAARR